MKSQGLIGKMATCLLRVRLVSALLIRFVLSSSGREFGVSRFQKLRMAFRVMRNNWKLMPLSTTRQHLIMMEQILKLPKSAPGDVVECGCYNGASTANLSMACSATKRRLFVCDSFEGLPAPRDEEQIAIVNQSSYKKWSKGQYDSEGGLEGVKNRIDRFGNGRVCHFIKGYFEDTLKSLPTDSIVLVFEDADLPSSVEQCLRHLWPKLREGCRFYSHEPWSVEVVSLFYDKSFWEENFGLSPPGFEGATAGGSRQQLLHASLGYAEKWNARRIVHHGRDMEDYDSPLTTRVKALIG